MSARQVVTCRECDNDCVMALEVLIKGPFVLSEEKKELKDLDGWRITCPIGVQLTIVGESRIPKKTEVEL